MFHPLYEKNPETMKNIHKQFIEELRKSVQVGVCLSLWVYIILIERKMLLIDSLLPVVLVELCLLSKMSCL